MKAWRWIVMAAVLLLALGVAWYLNKGGSADADSPVVHQVIQEPPAPPGVAPAPSPTPADQAAVPPAKSALDDALKIALAATNYGYVECEIPEGFKVETRAHRFSEMSGQTLTVAVSTPSGSVQLTRDTSKERRELMESAQETLALADEFVDAFDATDDSDDTDATLDMRAISAEMRDNSADMNAQSAAPRSAPPERLALRWTGAGPSTRGECTVLDETAMVDMVVHVLAPDGAPSPYTVLSAPTTKILTTDAAGEAIVPVWPGLQVFLTASHPDSVCAFLPRRGGPPCLYASERVRGEDGGEFFLQLRPAAKTQAETLAKVRRDYADPDAPRLLSALEGIKNDRGHSDEVRAVLDRWSEQLRAELPE